MADILPLKRGEGRKLAIPNNMLCIPTTLDISFFKWWCLFFKPCVNLANKEMDVVASLLKQRWELTKSISDPVILNSVLMSETTREKVVQECGISLQHYYVILSNLRKKKVITERGIEPKLIPNIREDSEGYLQLLILFTFDDKKMKA